jgi:hypothetical protein
VLKRAWGNPSYKKIQYFSKKNLTKNGIAGIIKCRLGESEGFGVSNPSHRKTPEDSIFLKKNLTSHDKYSIIITHAVDGIPKP